jgi:hypothetical protein
MGGQKAEAFTGAIRDNIVEMQDSASCRISVIGFWMISINFSEDILAKISRVKAVPFQQQSDKRKTDGGPENGEHFFPSAELESLLLLGSRYGHDWHLNKTKTRRP